MVQLVHKALQETKALLANKASRVLMVQLVLKALLATKALRANKA
jgi:hypothetical protein